MIVITYGVYDNDTLIFEGPTRELLEKFGIKTKSLSGYVEKNHKLLGKYTVKRLGTKDVKKYMTKKPKEDVKLNYLLEHLNRYGNTVFSRNPDEYLIKLKEYGLNCKARKVVDTDVKKRKKTYYIIEVI